MDDRAKQVALEVSEGSNSGGMTFPEVLAKLAAVGVERYHADLSRGERTYYMPDGSSYVVVSEEGENAAKDFSAAGVVAALRAIQAKKIDYRQFCADILDAGCVGYMVCLAGRRAVYFGRTGDNYVEMFPQAVLQPVQ